MTAPRYRLTWATPAGALVALAPTPVEIARHAGALAAAYNDPRNAPLLGHGDPISPAEVAEHYAGLAARGDHGFLVFLDGALAGDADLRGVRREAGAAEFAFLVAAVAAQGKGLGTRIATMLHAFAFARLGLDRVYASVVPANTATRRVFEKLGHRVDDSAAARAYADDPDDIVLVIDRATFARLHAPAMAEISIDLR
jgi:RimJ/RimL family protein N-acetyltransferase